METNHRGTLPTTFAAGFQKNRGIAKLKTVLAAVVAFAACASAHAELIPAARLVNWTPGVTVGVPGGIPTNRTRTIDVTQAPYNADRTGNADAAPAIQAAINASAANDVIYLPAGTYRLNTQLVLDFNKDNRTLRGAGPGATILSSRVTGGNAIYVGSSSDYNWSYPSTNNAITGGLTKGSTQITMANTAAYNVGAIVQLTFANDTNYPVVHVSGGKNLRQQKVRITGKTATSLSFTPALYTNYNPTGARALAAQLQTDGVGIEDMTVDCSNSGAVFGIQFEQCYGSWIKNVKVRRAKSYSVFLYDSLQCEMRTTHLDEIQNSGTNGAGLLMQGSAGCLVEDNIIYKAFPLMEINFGSAGNVFAYNFCEDSSVYGAVGSAINTNHGPHNNFNLYEGNVAPNVQADGFFGSASDDTIFRNWLHGTVPGVTGAREPILLQRFTRNYSVVGNLLGKAGVPFISISGAPAARGPYSFGLPNMGNTVSSGTAQLSAGDPWASYATLLSGGSPGPSGFQELDLDVEATLVLKGNRNLNSGTIPANESLGGDTLPSSLYLAAKPAWFGNLAWPAFDPANPNAKIEAIPAGYRYLLSLIHI